MPETDPRLAERFAREDTRLRVGVLISGSGTNLQALIDAAGRGELDAHLAVVISNKEAAFGLERARRAGIPAVFIDRSLFDTPHAYNAAIAQTLALHGAELVVMAGYMRLLGTEVLNAFPERVINLHPALLPAFPGASAIHDAYEHGVKLTGVTVHFASEEFDRGPIIAQRAVPVLEEDTLETLEARIHGAEHAVLPQAVQLFAEDRLEIVGRRVRILPPR